jgi:hypothetical protein
MTERKYGTSPDDLEEVLKRGGPVSRANYEKAPEEVKKLWWKDYWDMTEEEQEIIRRYQDEQDSHMTTEEIEKRDKALNKYLETHRDEYPEVGRPKKK